MQWTPVKVVGQTLTLEDGLVLSRGPLGWEAPRPAGTAGPYEICATDGSFATYYPVPGVTAVYPFRPTLPNTVGMSAIALNDPL